MARRKCRYADHYVEQTYLVGRKSGGSYRRSNTSQHTGICGPCAVRLLPYFQPGHLTISQWDVVGLDRAVERFAEEATDLVEKAKAIEVLAEYRAKRERQKAERAERDARMARFAQEQGL